jgi:ATP-dependent 26S proteasome regulatory subunit
MEIQQLETAIRARYPIIAINSDEEQRVLRILSEIAAQQNKALYSWSVIDGFQTVTEAGTCDGGGDMDGDPIGALTTLKSRTDGEGRAIYVFKDLHAFLSDPMLLRALRNAARELVVGRKTLVLLSPVIKLPRDLEKEVLALDFPLPGRDELLALIDEVAEGARANDLPVSLNGDTETLVNALAGLTEDEVRRVMRLSLLTTREFGASSVPIVLKEKKQIIEKSGVLEYYDAKATAHDIGGLDLLKQYVDERRGAFTQEARDFSLDTPRGILMVGPPGTGKSLMAKVVAGGKMPLLRLDMGALMGSLVGESEANLRKVFAVCRAIGNAVLWIDEIEKAMSGMDGASTDGGTSQRMLASLLTWMQEQSGIYIVATANNVQALRPEVIRRFDDLFFVDLPDEDNRRAILAIHLAKRNRTVTGYDLQRVAALTEGFSGAELEKVVVKALYAAWGDEKRELTTDDLVAAAQNVVPVSKTMDRELAALREWAKTRALPAATMRAKEQAPADIEL